MRLFRAPESHKKCELMTLIDAGRIQPADQPDLCFPALVPMWMKVCYPIGIGVKYGFSNDGGWWAALSHPKAFLHLLSKW